VHIAVIGTGNVGQALGGALARAGHDVVFAARDEEKTKKVASKLGASAARTPADAAAQADVVVLAIPYAATTEVAREIGDKADGKIVVDVTNPIAPDYSGLATKGGPSGAERVAKLFNEAQVVKAFNTLFASLQANPRAHGEPLDALFATDDEEAKETIAELIESLGFRPVHVGSLEHAAELESMAWLNISLQMQSGGDWRSSFVLLGAPEQAVPAEPQAAVQSRG
jgi:NADPH-dependent F420 reductase